MSTNKELDPELARRLSVLRAQPERDPAKAAQGRAAFLAQAEAMREILPQPVTNVEQQRHIKWMHPLVWAYPLAWIRPREWIRPIQAMFHVQRKERSPMFSALGTILLIVALVLGGSGATVAAAQGSMPDQMLYPVKTWSEDVRVQVSSNTQSRLELALEYSQRRAEEMQKMFQAGQVPPDAVQARMQAEIDLAIQLAAGQPDGEAVKALEQIRQQLQVHEQLFLNLGNPADPQAAALLERTRAMLQDHLHLCEVGLLDPAMLREQLRERDRDQTREAGITPSAPAMMPSLTGQGNPWVTGTPTPGSGYGPGPGDGAENTGGAGNKVGAGSTGSNGGNNPWTTGTPTPGSGYGPGPGDGNGGNNPWTTGTPTPGSGYGPGPGTQPGDGSGNSAGSGNGSGSGTTDGAGANGAGGSTNGGTGGNDAGGNPDGGNGGTDAGTGGSGSGAGGPGGRH